MRTKAASLWEPRIERTRQLRARYPVANELLGFYEHMLTFQHGIANECTATLDPSTGLREQIDIGFASRRVPALLDLTIQHAPPALAAEAGKLKQDGGAASQEIIEEAVRSPRPALDELHAFFASAVVQPLAEMLQVQWTEKADRVGSACPVCGGLPQLAVLRPEGEGASRSLLCSFCLREWTFRRLICPWCGEENKEKLPRYSAAECDYVHVEACDTCHGYLKAVDASVDGHSVPLVDEVAWAALDLWAADHSYTKIVRNLVGL